MKTIVCIGGRCSSWGKNWDRHMYDGGEQCLRCGMDRKEQFEEDKMCGLVSGEYKPNTGKPRAERKITSKQIMYCAVSEEAIEHESTTLNDCKAWIKSRIDSGEVDDDYFYIETFTKAELAAMPEA